MPLKQPRGNRVRIVVVANDTRGGVQPYIALGAGLQDAGHNVRVVAPADFASMVTSRGLAFSGLSGNAQADARRVGSTSKRGPIASMRSIAGEMTTRMETWTRETLEASDGADLLTGGVGGMIVGLSVADKLSVPFVPTHLQPVDAPTGDYPGVLFAGMPTWLGRPGRRLGHTLTGLALWTPFKRPMMSARASVLKLSGPPAAAKGQPVLYGFSPRVVQVPTVPGKERHVTGYWFADSSGWTPPPALDAFLAREGPVVSIGFGSMTGEDPARFTATVLSAVRAAGVRAVLLSGWGGLAATPDTDDVLVADAVPHDWLFPRVAAAVHHGGAGTTGAALRAGIPAIVVPFGADQPFWGARVAALGVGPAPIPRRQLTGQGLAAALSDTLADAAMRSRAADFGMAMRAEDGVAAAVLEFDRIGRSGTVFPA